MSNDKPTTALIEEGAPCPDGCGGTLILPPVKGCRCFISPPCSACTDNKLVCNLCGWEEEEPEYVPPSKEQIAYYEKWMKEAKEARARGHTFQHGGRIFNVDYDSSSGSTMVFSGQYEGPVTASDIRTQIGDGTFGHRGPTMSGGRFTYTKITD